MTADAPMQLWFDRSPIGVFSAARDGRILRVNPALARMLGYTPEELLAKNLTFDIYADPAERAALHAESWERGTCDGARVRWRHRDGRVRTIQLWGHILKAEDPPVFEAWAIDVTEEDAATKTLRRQRQELERTATTLQLVMRQIPAVYWVVDRELRVIEGGGAIDQIVGVPPGHFLGMTISQIYATSSPWTIDPLPLHQRALDGNIVEYETEFRGKLLKTTLGPYRGSDGQIEGVIGTSLDVTAVRTLERRMIDAQRAESLGVLAGGLAHDFNNLLVAVIGSADLALRELPTTSPARGAVTNIRTAGLRAAELTDELLTFAGRRGAGTTRVKPASIVEELLRIVAPTIPPDVRVEVDIPPELALRGDPAQVRQVLLNLIANARDALGNAGTISIRAQPLAHASSPDDDDVLVAPAGAYVVLEVADNGPGLDRETRRHVFEPFFTTKPQGHGLGLAAVLGIVRAHGGGLRASATPGRGARFQVLWPAAEGPTTAEMPRLAARTVLVVDDEALVRDVLARMIEDLGYAAVTAPDGEAALELVGRQRVDAVLVDLTMPRMSGTQVIAALRRDHPDLPVVLCSGYDRDARGPIRADAYLPKPFRIEALERTLAELLPLRNV